MHRSETDGSIEYLSNNLRWFVWCGFPWKLLPQNFNPTRLVHLELHWSSLHHLWNETKELKSLQRLDLSYSERLKSTPDFEGMPNLEYLDLRGYTSLEEVHPSLRYSTKLIELNLDRCESLERFPYVNVESLESMDLYVCSSLKKFPEILGRMKPELKITTEFSGLREIPSSIIHLLVANLTKLDLGSMESLVSLPSSICKLKGLVMLDVSTCFKLGSLPEEIGDLENLEYLDASYTLISQPPSSIVRLNKLELLTFGKEEESEDRSVCFVFPQVNEGLCSVEYLRLSYCNLIDEGLPEDIGSLSSLQNLDLSGNNFEHLPESIAQLGALQSLDLSNCKRLTQLPEFPQQLYRIEADWRSDAFCNSLFHNISSLQHDICDSLRVFSSITENIPSWFHHQGKGASVSVNLPENWHLSDNFLGFAVCYFGELIDDITAHLIPLCDDGTSSMTQKFALSNHSDYDINFFLLPLAGLWDASKANGKTPNDYEIISLIFGEVKKYGVRLLYKDEPELHIGIRRSRYEEGSCSCSKKQRPLLQLFPTSPGL